MREGAFRTKVLAYLRKRGGHWDSNPVSAFGHAGRADIIGCYKGHFVAIELKAPGRKGGLSTDQALYLESVGANGGIWMVANEMLPIARTLDTLDE